MLFPRWSAALREETGIDNGYRRNGGVDVAWTAAEELDLQTTAGRWRVEGIVHERLAAGDFCRVEPALNPELRAVYFLPDRAQVRNPWHLRALAAAAARRGVRLRPWVAVVGWKHAATGSSRYGRPRGCFACGWVIMAAGPWSGGLLGELGVHAPTPPLKGQIVLLRQIGPCCARIVEHGKNYLVPREDGRILIGATEENAGFDTRPTVGGVRDLLDEALRLCPALARPEVERPGPGCVPAASTPGPISAWCPAFATYRRHRPQARRPAALTGDGRAGRRPRPGPAPRIDLAPFPGRSPSPTTRPRDTFRS